MTTVYLVRHSIPFKEHRGIEEVDESVLFSNIKTPLSVDGEELARKVSLNDEFSNIDVVWSSDYVRTMATAKYFAYNNNLKVNVSSLLGERRHGVDSWNELPSDFETKQFSDENYKIDNGESRKEVTDRILKKLYHVIDDNKNKMILIVGHSTAFAYLLSNWCEISYDGSYTFKGKEFFDGKWDYCESFKLIFDDNNNLVSIENLIF